MLQKLPIQMITSQLHTLASTQLFSFRHFHRSSFTSSPPAICRLIFLPRSLPLPLPLSSIHQYLVVHFVAVLPYTHLLLHIPGNRPLYLQLFVFLYKPVLPLLTNSSLLFLPQNTTFFLTRRIFLSTSTSSTPQRSYLLVYTIASLTGKEPCHFFPVKGLHDCSDTTTGTQ